MIVFVRDWRPRPQSWSVSGVWSVVRATECHSSSSTAQPRPAASQQTISQTDKHCSAGPRSVSRCHALERIVTRDMCVTEASLAGLLAALQATHSRVEAECGELQGDLARLGQVSSDWSVVGHVTSILTSDWPGDPAPAAAGRRCSDEGRGHSGREVVSMATDRRDH